ncbi:hypothetical protein Ccrd_005644 [Cynara cardunculus var. scolymus]|uniref:Uncharacterized protein n=1 Tax=Cynara cardunculus var. scolymus TaxID=59895 RepID=A0A124SC09_CYNCS|nr:hypothetical protein Ccrd_005644 [Cynara cardunculus var. scolymus]
MAEVNCNEIRNQGIIDKDSDMLRKTQDMQDSIKIRTEGKLFMHLTYMKLRFSFMKGG